LSETSLRDKLQSMLGEPVLQQASMRKFTTWKIGGPADLLAFPGDEEELAALLRFLWENEIPRVVVGNGSNILVGDKGIRGVVIKMGEPYAACEWHEGGVSALAGAMLPALAHEAAARGLSGLEFAAGIPGSLGGAVRMNAGAYGSTVGQYVTKVVMVEYNGTRRELEAGELEFAYRESNLAAMPGVISGVELALPLGDPQESRAKIGELLHLRGVKQPLEYPSCGSVFRNPQNDHAGRLIEIAGLRGMQVGGAMVSRKHGNFIINLGGAKAADVSALIKEVQRRVKEVTGVELAPEVKMIGE